ncbi:type II toxin-antitoxin system Phd/YefM family antitoxin [Kitasatospora sp. RB6PN24]|uniref:type II toxin-antitoxin system Phd/YefM family antitoxin n=1 Tax=Kitasatospora humi TaxID=2893891 RepID=UPI001E52F2F9|nr:type II toxin-antitoxin system Phd/YefM family antitoxin [Kitasatospora humi]MCC9308678.1 type II toxin-antitoxin system Phd/YefM family antitoxin [Kitasatospora humi]
METSLDSLDRTRKSMRWQVQEAKQKFSEVLRHAESEGPQFVTRHGDEVAVIIDIREYRRLKGGEMDLRDYLLLPGPPYFDDLDKEIVRSPDVPGFVDLGEDE